MPERIGCHEVIHVFITFQHLEYRNRLSTLGELLYFLAHPEENPSIPEDKEKHVAAAVVDDMVEKVSGDADKDAL